MNDPLHLDAPTSLDALRRVARDERDAAADASAAAGWFDADATGARLPIALGAEARYATTDLDAIGADILAPLAR